MPEIERPLETFLVVEDIEAASALYRDVLGLEPYGETIDRGALFRLPGGQLLGLMARKAATEPNEIAGGTVPVVLPKEEGGGGTARRAAGHGPPGLRRGGRSFYFRDPDGHLLELVTPGLWDFC